MGFQNYLDDNAINSTATPPPLRSHISTSPPFCYLENFDGHIGKRWFRSALTHFYLGSFRFMLSVLCVMMLLVGLWVQREGEYAST